MSKRSLVAGGAGFLGSHLVERLLQEGHLVICVDNLISGSKSNIKSFMDNKNFSFLEHNVTETLLIDEPVDQVWNLASPASPVDYGQYPIQTLKVGALGTHNLLGLALKHNARFLLASTSEVYGDPLESPQRESYWGNVNPIGPRGVYDEAKRFAEALTMAYGRVHGVKIHIARIFNTYGPRMRLKDGRAIPAFIGQALKAEPLTVFGDGRQTRSFCYVSDLIEGLYRLMQSDLHEPVNLGNPDEMTILQMAEQILQLQGVKDSRGKISYQSLPEDDPKVRCPDIQLAKSKLKWEPKVQLEDGLRETLQWFKEFSP